MLPAAYRMRRREDFTAGVRRGRRAGRPLLVVHLLPGGGSGSSSPRVGFIASRAVGTAVVRNRVLRRLRHLMAGRLHRLPGESLVVIRAKPAASLARYDELGSDLDDALERVLQQLPRTRR